MINTPRSWVRFSHFAAKCVKIQQNEYRSPNLWIDTLFIVSWNSFIVHETFTSCRHLCLQRQGSIKRQPIRHSPPIALVFETTTAQFAEVVVSMVQWENRGLWTVEDSRAFAQVMLSLVPIDLPQKFHLIWTEWMCDKEHEKLFCV